MIIDAIKKMVIKRNGSKPGTSTLLTDSSMLSPKELNISEIGSKTKAFKKASNTPVIASFIASIAVFTAGGKDMVTDNDPNIDGKANKT